MNITLYLDKENQLRIVGNNKSLSSLTFKQLKQVFPNVKAKTKTYFLRLVRSEFDAGVKRKKKKGLKILAFFVVSILILIGLVSYFIFN